MAKLNALTSVFQVLGCNVAVESDDSESFFLLGEAYSAFKVNAESSSTDDLVLRIHIGNHGPGWSLRTGGTVIDCDTSADLLYDFEKTLELRIQEYRSELFFSHAAVVSLGDRCAVISGESGSGKSTLAWSLCEMGFSYLSDELAPIHPELLHVEPYPHALCLKTEPPEGPALPMTTIRTSATMHVPAYELPCHPVDKSCLIAALIFLDPGKIGRELAVSSIGHAESAARLYSNGLNQLAHSNHGLSAAARITRSAPSVFVSGGTIEDRVQMVRDIL